MSSISTAWPLRQYLTWLTTFSAREGVEHQFIIGIWLNPSWRKEGQYPGKIRQQIY